MSSIINYFVVRSVCIKHDNAIGERYLANGKLKVIRAGKARDIVLNKTYSSKHHALEFGKCADLQFVLLSR